SAAISVAAVWLSFAAQPKMVRHGRRRLSPAKSARLSLRGTTFVHELPILRKSSNLLHARTWATRLIRACAPAFHEQRRAHAGIVTPGVQLALDRPGRQASAQIHDHFTGSSAGAVNAR